MKVVIQVVLWILCVFFSYKIYDSINGPIAFNYIKAERYAKVISKLKDIGNAQAAHKDILGYYSDNLDSLVAFIDTAQYTPKKEIQVIWSLTEFIELICFVK